MVLLDYVIHNDLGLVGVTSDGEVVILDSAPLDSIRWFSGRNEMEQAKDSFRDDKRAYYQLGEEIIEKRDRIGLAFIKYFNDGD